MSDPAADEAIVRSSFVWLAASGESIPKREAKAREAEAAFSRLLALLKEHGTSEISEAPEAPVAEVSEA